jgi:type I restriction enzyme, S subunit
VFASYLIRLRPSSQVVPDFLYIYFQSSNYWTQIRAKARGGAQPNVNATLLAALSLPLPPRDEQSQIAAILNEQMAAAERARTAAEAQLEAAKALPAACLRTAFESTEAQSWPRRQLGEISRLLPAKSIATDGDKEVLAVTTACLSETGFVKSGVKKARMRAKDAAECVLTAGEVLIARSNTPELVGRAALFQGEPEGAVASDLTIRIWPTAITSEFLAAYLSFLFLTGYWKERAGGASGSMKKITRKHLQSQQVPVPPVSDQLRVTGLLQEWLSFSAGARTAAEGELAAVESLPSALLRRAFSGEL